MVIYQKLFNSSIQEIRPFVFECMMGLFFISLVNILLFVNDLASQANIQELQPVRDLETKIKTIHEFL